MKPITTRAKQNGGIIKECDCGKTPAKKALVGDQNQLPQQLQNAIKAAPGKMYGSPAKMGCGKKKY